MSREARISMTLFTVWEFVSEQLGSLECWRISRNGIKHSSNISWLLLELLFLKVRANPRERQMTNAPRIASSSPSTVNSWGGVDCFCHGRRNPVSDSSSMPRTLLIVGPMIPLRIFVAYFTCVEFLYHI